MTDRRSEITLELLAVPLHNAIQALVITQEAARPFVVVTALGASGLPRHLERKPLVRDGHSQEDGGRGGDVATFVQFCTLGDRLLYDCPPLKELAQPCAVEDAVRLARSALERQGVQPNARLELWEHSDELIPRRSLLGLFVPGR